MKFAFFYNLCYNGITYCDFIFFLLKEDSYENLFLKNFENFKNKCGS